jgi:hypothetical protein
MHYICVEDIIVTKLAKLFQYYIMKGEIQLMICKCYVLSWNYTFKIYNLFNHHEPIIFVQSCVEIVNKLIIVGLWAWHGNTRTACIVINIIQKTIHYLAMYGLLSDITSQSGISDISTTRMLRWDRATEFQ